MKAAAIARLVSDGRARRVDEIGDQQGRPGSYRCSATARGRTASGPAGDGGAKPNRPRYAPGRPAHRAPTAPAGMARSGPSSSDATEALAEQCCRVGRAQRLEPTPTASTGRPSSSAGAPGKLHCGRGQALSLLDRGGADQQPRLRSRTWSERAAQRLRATRRPTRTWRCCSDRVALADCPAADLDLNPHVGRQPVSE